MCTNPSSYMFLWLKKQRQSIIDTLGGECIYPGCGCDTQLHIHHINGLMCPVKHDKTGGRHKWDRIKEWRVSLEAGNLLLVCEEHHNSHHAGEININLFKYKPLSDYKTQIILGAEAPQ